MNVVDYLLVVILGFCTMLIIFNGQRIYKQGHKVTGLFCCIFGILLALFMFFFSAFPTVVGCILWFACHAGLSALSKSSSKNSAENNKYEKAKPNSLKNDDSNIVNDSNDMITDNNSSFSSSKLHDYSNQPTISQDEPVGSHPESDYPLYELKIHKKRKKLSNYVVIDIETTGLDAPYDKVIQLSALKVIDDKITDSFDTYVNPGKNKLPLNSFIENLTHIYTSDLNGAPSFEDIKPKFLSFVGKLPWVGHNIIRFDIPFLYENGLGPKEYWAADTYLLSKRKLNRYVLGNLKLPTLKKYYQINEPSHNSLDDCRTTHYVYQHLIHDEMDNYLDEVQDKNKIKDFHSFKGINFVVIGEFPEIYKPYLINQITFRDGNVDSRILKRTDFVINGISKRPHKLLAKANDWNFKILSYYEFVKLANEKDRQRS